MPNTLKNVKIIIKSILLPEDKYIYGYCTSSKGRFNKCSRTQYINSSVVGGNINSTNRGCSVFILEKGNPNIKCDFMNGT